jgi:pimeloyl-ACP methyl ester carboxylesterase
MAETGLHSLGRLFILHGFFGSGRNWSAIARGLIRSRPDWEAVLVDLRLHGESEGATAPHTVAACARDVALLSESMPASSGPTAVLGHSFGGKVAMLVPEELGSPCSQVWVIDSTPSPGVTGAGARQMLDLLSRLPDAFESRRAGADAVERGGFPRFVAEWMATNLVRRGERYVWRFDMGEMSALLSDFFRTDLWDRIEESRSDCEFRFVRASNGSILSDEDANRLARLESEGNPVRIDTLDGGHWLNVDNPDGLIDQLRKGLPRS